MYQFRTFTMYSRQIHIVYSFEQLAPKIYLHVNNTESLFYLAIIGHYFLLTRLPY